MMTSTTTSTYTRTQTATYLSDVLMGTMRDILVQLGISAKTLLDDWDQNQRAIAAWISEGSLGKVVLECHQPQGAVNPIFEFPISYDAANVGDRAFVTSQASIVSYISKVRSVSVGSTFKLYCEFQSARTPQPGWQSGNRSATSQLQARTIGTLASGPHASTAARIYT
ncbi:hypothetical protein [Clavibacter michiganensis]|uniref:hypothetical protein n=1 Tax=Clavibacter michiganensis TaxID=28447 RepID=UPI00374CC23E